MSFGEKEYEPMILEESHIETDRAILFINGGDDMWVPRSLIGDITNKPDGTVEVEIESWWLEKEGWV